MAPIIPIESSQMEYANNSPRVLVEKETPTVNAMNATTNSSTFNIQTEENANQRYIIIDGVKYLMRS